MNKLISDWLEREHIDVSEVSKRTNCRLYTNANINPISAKYGVYHEQVQSEISIGDIVGIEDDHQIFIKGKGNTLFEELSYLYKEQSDDQYSERENSLLFYPKETVLDKLSENFEQHPIGVIEVDKGKYAISGDGKHRFVLLKSIYLAELAKIDVEDQDKIDALKKRYTIPVNLRQLDYNQTYSNFFISLFGFYDVEATKIRPEPQSSTVLWKGQEYTSYKEKSLIEFAKRIIKENKNIFKEEYKGKKQTDEVLDERKLRFIRAQEMEKELPSYYRTIDSFRKYVNKNMRDVFIEKDANNKDSNEIEI